MAHEPDNLSSAGLDYGRALCLPVEAAATPWDQLSPAEQACVQAVGGTFERKVEQKLGFAGGPPDPPGPPAHTESTPIAGPTGQRVGSVEFDRGVVTVCWTSPSGGTPPGCEFVGYGLDAYLSAQLLLDALGFHTG